jgi:hypothetical protein
MHSYSLVIFVNVPKKNNPMLYGLAAIEKSILYSYQVIVELG